MDEYNDFMTSDEYIQETGDAFDEVRGRTFGFWENYAFDYTSINDYKNRFYASGECKKL